MKFPEDIRYAHRIWMSMVLITPILHDFLLILFSELAIDAIAINYVFTVFRNGLILIVYWAILLIMILSVNSWNYTVNTKKWIIQWADIAFISLFFGGLVVFNGDTINLERLLLTLPYFITCSSAIWFFELKSKIKKMILKLLEKF